MLPFGMLLAWAGYGIGSWGWVLVKGYNITLRAWFSPLHPYQWPAKGSVPMIPKGHLYPTTAAAGQQPAGSGRPPPPSSYA